VLFFEDFHSALLDLLSSALRPDGGKESADMRTDDALRLNFFTSLSC
jgi:hypothetical protein